ncbi:Homeodomain-like protein [Cladorrhinum sp. PSN259]|nr:Homeodomain-like protein [Cladorrhinum sp. PSN259]
MENNEERKKSHRGRKRWTEEEDAILYDEANKQSSNGSVRDWNKIATKLPGRTNKDCRKRWVNKVCGGLKKGLWDREEDQRLQAAVEKHGLKWPLVAAEVGFRSPDQCAKRWQYGLDPRLKHREWTQDEDDLLLSLAQLHGRQWKAFQQKHYPTRSRIDLKNRYTILMRRMNNNGGDQDSTCPDDETSETSSVSGAGSDEGMISSGAHSRTGYESDHAHHNGIDHQHHTSNMQGLHQADWLADMSTYFTPPLTRTSSGHHHGSLGHHLDSDSLGDGITPTNHLGGLDFLDSATPMNMTSSMSHNLLASTWDDPILGTSYLHGYTSAPAAGHGTFSATSDIPSTTSMEAKQDINMEMPLNFDPELMNHSGPRVVHTTASQSHAANGGMVDPDHGAGPSDMQTEEDGEGPGDMGKVVIAVDGCDKDTLDYLFSMTRPIKQRVKMEITM